jgi:alcohol dehydrogenase, propanol-preferring
VFSLSLRGSRTELIELIELAHQGICEIAVGTFSLDNGAMAYCRLAANT